MSIQPRLQATASKTCSRAQTYIPKPVTQPAFITESVPYGVKISSSNPHPLIPSTKIYLTDRLTQNESQMAHLIRVDEERRMLHNLHTNKAYKAQFISQIKPVVNCMADTKSSDLVTSIKACNKLDKLSTGTLLDYNLKETVEILKTLYFHSDGTICHTALTQPTEAGRTITNFADAIEKRTKGAIPCHEVMEPSLYNCLKKSSAGNATGKHCCSHRHLSYEEAQAFNTAVDDCCQACANCDPAKASAIAKKYPQEKIFQALAEQCERQHAQALQNAHATLYDEYGIVRVAQRDPIYIANRYAINHATVAEKEIINQNLLIRHHLKTKMHELWSIPENASDSIHNALYSILGKDGAATADIATLQSQIEQIVARSESYDYSELVKAFYEPNGVLKELALQAPETKNIARIERILTPECAFQRKQLNDLICIQLKSPSKVPQAKKAIEYMTRWLIGANTTEQIESKAAFEKAYEAIMQPTNSTATQIVGKSASQTVMQAAQEAAHSASQVEAQEITDVKSSMPMPQGPELEPEKKTVFKTAVKQEESISLAGYDSSLGNLKKLEEAANMFKDNPSAIAKDGPLTRLLKCGKAGKPAGSSVGNLGSARGAAYELEKASDLAKAGEKIVGFGRKLGGREFDIETATKLIECKNIDWKKINDIAGNMKSTFGEQAEIAKSVNKIFEVHSKNSVPEAWVKWFTSKGIKVVEG